jgi:hypothetical protein
MNRAWPLGILFLIFIYLGANVSSMWLWVITGVSVFLLFALMFIMFQRGKFIGPSTLIDDARFIKNRFIMDDDENSDIEIVDVAVRRRQSSADNKEI